MVLAKEEMAEKNNFTHLILIVEARTHIQKKALDLRPPLQALTYELSKRINGRK